MENQIKALHESFLEKVKNQTWNLQESQGGLTKEEMNILPEMPVKEFEGLFKSMGISIKFSKNYEGEVVSVYEPLFSESTIDNHFWNTLVLRIQVLNKEFFRFMTGTLGYDIDIKTLDELVADKTENKEEIDLINKETNKVFKTIVKLLKKHNPERYRDREVDELMYEIMTNPKTKSDVLTSIPSTVEERKLFGPLLRQITSLAHTVNYCKLDPLFERNMGKFEGSNTANVYDTPSHEEIRRQLSNFKIENILGNGLLSLLKNQGGIVNSPHKRAPNKGNLNPSLGSSGANFIPDIKHYLNVVISIHPSLIPKHQNFAGIIHLLTSGSKNKYNSTQRNVFLSEARDIVIPNGKKPTEESSKLLNDISSLSYETYETLHSLRKQILAEKINIKATKGSKEKLKDLNQRLEAEVTIKEKNGNANFFSKADGKYKHPTDKIDKFIKELKKHLDKNPLELVFFASEYKFLKALIDGEQKIYTIVKKPTNISNNNDPEQGENDIASNVATDEGNSPDAQAENDDSVKKIVDTINVVFESNPLKAIMAKLTENQRALLKEHYIEYVINSLFDNLNIPTDKDSNKGMENIFEDQRKMIELNLLENHPTHTKVFSITTPTRTIITQALIEHTNKRVDLIHGQTSAKTKSTTSSFKRG